MSIGCSDMEAPSFKCGDLIDPQYLLDGDYIILYKDQKGIILESTQDQTEILIHTKEFPEFENLKTGSVIKIKFK